MSRPASPAALLLRLATLSSLVASSWIHHGACQSMYAMATVADASLPSSRAGHSSVQVDVAASAPTAAKTTLPSMAKRMKYKVLQVQIVHRHGDRTPITPMKNETFWSSALPPPHVLDGISRNTKLKRDGDGFVHGAGGRGPFGQLTHLGLLQMVELGSRLREELHLDDDDDGPEHHVDENGHHHVHRGRLFTPRDPLHPKRIKVTSTDFPRTVQSVQGVLVGLFPDGFRGGEGEDGEHHVEIDLRHTNTMIPDPQPRRSKEQEELERILASRPHLAKKEEEMQDLAVRTTAALRTVLGDGADDVSFGIGEEKEKNERRNLSWGQLSEITKCLRVRDMLPPEVSHSDQDLISSHAAWRWFENLRHPRLAKLAMHGMVSTMLDVMRRGKECSRIGAPHEVEPWLHLYSAHDSTLIGLLCAFRLEQPAEWPEYGSYLKLELLEAEEVDDGALKGSNVQYYVRFSLNGQVLRSEWSAEDDPPGMISLDRLTHMVHSDHEEDIGLSELHSATPESEEL